MDYRVKTYCAHLWISECVWVWKNGNTLGWRVEHQAGNRNLQTSKV